MRSEDLDQSAELRRQAEVILAKISLAKNGRSKQWDELSSEDQSRVLHELEVHQIEVEMQNDELRQLGEKLHSSRARYFNLYDQAPLGYITVNGEGLIHEANRSAATMLGSSRRALLNQPFSQVIHHEDAESFENLHKRLFETKIPSASASRQAFVDMLRNHIIEASTPRTCELRMVRIDGTTFWVSLVANVAQDEGGAPLLYILMNDVTERKQAEEERDRHALTTTRRFLSVLVLEQKYLGSAVQRLNPDEIQTGFDLFWNSFYRFVTDEGGGPLPPQSQEFIAIFGVETSCFDHAVRAVNAAAAISTWLRERAAKFSQSGMEIPHFSIALHYGEAVAMRIPGGESLPWVVLGEAVSFARPLIRVCRIDEVICSESFLGSFLGNHSADLETHEITGGDEPDLAGLNWEVADFIPLEDNFRSKSILVGPHVKTQPDSATVRFTFLYAFSCRISEAPTRVASIVFPNAIPRISDSAAKADSEPPPRWIGKYRLLHILGQGGMGTVWLGQDCFKNRVAIKVLLNTMSAEGDLVTRFEREAKVMMQLNHRNICRIFEMSEYDGMRYIAMEYVSGLTLTELMNNVPGRSETNALISGAKVKTEEWGLNELVRMVLEKKQKNELRKKCQPWAPALPTLRLEQALPLFLKICDAVQFAHEKGVLHRDLKPENILIREDGDPVLSDFGLAKLKRDSNGGSSSFPGQLIGTLAYMAPEQLHLDEQIDERADVFGLGSILYRMLTGHAQFRTSENIVADIQALESHKPLPPSYHRKSIPKDMDLIVMKSLCKDPVSRYGSVQSMRDDIARTLDGEPISVS